MGSLAFAMIYILAWLAFLTGFMVGIVWHTIATEEHAAEGLHRRVLLTLHLQTKHHRVVFFPEDAAPFIQLPNLN